MKKPARLSPELIERLAAGIEEGLSYKTAATLAGITERGFHKLIAQGRQGKRGLAVLLVQRITKAGETAKANSLKYIKELSEGRSTSTTISTKKDANGNVLSITETVTTALPSLAAATWLLERRFPEEFGPRSLLEVTNGANPFQVTLFGAVRPGSDTDVEIQDGPDVPAIEYGEE